MTRRVIDCPAAAEETTFSDRDQHVTVRRGLGSTLKVSIIDAFGADAMIEITPATARAVAAMLVAIADAKDVELGKRRVA
jgi:hypothetical protein